MEFWGIEIKPEKPFKMISKDGYMVHANQVTLGEVDKVKEDENVPVYVKIGDDKSGFIIGNLSQKFPQVSLDIFLGHEFEISHNSKTSVYLIGYRTPMDEQDEEIDSDSELEEFMEQQIDALPQNEMNNEMNPEEDGSSDDSDEMGLDEDDESSDEEDVEAEAQVPPSKKMSNGIHGIPKGGDKNKSSGGKKRCPFPCGSSCKK
ncbi:histone deacetylase HDT4 isoform X1 [Arabidopsis lyrata subsp. lyrata]|uniref:histone deacetylase HDT4 isoform X1 n=1 Tax=Arabidopsis lyrata subsp. lyrata TaxID=81972 RepID=UPI000A29CF0F|nr:histone deacetylase HDT4 isoform X1 [Arabidopsis lyrata subsp. lyrata]|eukprot:XP_020883812.1 histone deacetylase HDT4 isoform X1 [Arabidopsis lyrata subsp. lyrata]